MKTLKEFIVEKKEFPLTTLELIALFSAIKQSAEMIQQYLSKTVGFNLIDMITTQNMITRNIHGEQQMKLDLLANEKIKSALRAYGVVAGIASEEDDDIVIFKGRESAKYIVIVDPLDGSSNIDINIAVGTIFSVYRRLTPIGSKVITEDFLQPGNQQVAAGYILYGSSTILVFTVGCGVHVFTYDKSKGIFYLIKERISFPSHGKIYSINMGNYINFSLGIQRYLEFCHKETQNQRPYTLRYSGSLVADFHRNLLKGGIYLYPHTANYPQGKLRLMYECNPMALIAEQSGGKASNGTNRILDLNPIRIHQRSPLFIGNNHMVNEVEKCLRET
ncbi:MAG: class 1 fructose-bisphosphatase [Candidatus Dasytiphilus stammeri]